VSSTKINKPAARRQSSQRRLPSSHVKKRPTRLEYIFFYSIPFVHLKIHSRNYRSRAKRRRGQLIFHPIPRSDREILVQSANPKKRKTTKRPAAVRTHPWLRWQTAGLASIFIIPGLAGAVYFGSHLHRQVSFNVSKGSAGHVLAVRQPASKVMAQSIPTELIIPKIGLDTPLAQTGLDEHGAVAMPWDIDTAAWYQYSPTPGQLGPAIIVGHLDGANFANLKGVFFRLNELVPGDEITIDRADGSVAKFKVIAMRQVSQANFPTTDIYGNINYAGLRVITCGGTFDSATGHYSDNTVAFAALE
jgi:sortase (surface protein transpeptidase)